MDNVRYNISPCEQGEVTRFIDKIDTNEFKPNGTVRATERSHYDRYSFLCNENRVAVVYDTTACIVSITGRQDFAVKLLNLFDPQSKTVKQSTVPAQGSVPSPRATEKKITPLEVAVPVGGGAGTRAKLFVSPDSIRRRNEFAPAPTVFASAKGAVVSTDEIYPPQTVKRKATTGTNDIYKFDQDVHLEPPPVKRSLPSYGESNLFRQSVSPITYGDRSEQSTDNANGGLTISVSSARAPSDAPRRAVISFGDNDSQAQAKPDPNVNAVTRQDVQPEKRRRGRPPKTQKAQNDIVGGVQALAYNQPVTQPQPEQPAIAQSVGAAEITASAQPEKRRRGRPPKNKQPINNQQNASNAEISGSSSTPSEPPTKNGYSVKNYPPEALIACIRKLRESGRTVIVDGTENANTPQELRSYTVLDQSGSKLWLRYATKRMTVQLQGKDSPLFDEVIKRLSTALNATALAPEQSNVQQVQPVQQTKQPKQQNNRSAQNTRSARGDVYVKMKKRIPTAFEYLSEQSKSDIACGMNDFAQQSLMLSDYSVLLVPAYRGLERFVFELQRARGINVKMIGQAFDKDDTGNYVLKSGYVKRIDSVVYAEVTVALYTEYFSRRNFFAHSDNTDNNVSRSIPERAAAQKIFDHLLDVLEYNAKKLKEIGFTMDPTE